VSVLTKTQILVRAARYTALARERQARDLQYQGDSGFHYVYDEDAAQRVLDFFPKYLRHFKGEWAGQPFHLEEWQAEIVRALFGWKDAETGLRRFRRAYIEIPKQNGKSSLAAGLGLYMTIGDREPGAQVFSAATKKDQAKIVHGYAVQMLARSPALKKFAKTRVNNIHVPDLGSRFEPLGADSDTTDGLNPHLVIADELHAYKTRHLLDTLETGMASRTQPLTAMITTAGVYDPTKVGWLEHEYATQVLEGVFEDERLYAYIASADKDDDWRDPETWRRANPNYGVSVREDYLRAAAERAEREPSFLNSFLRYHLNIWTEQIDRWLPMDKWDEGGGPVDADSLAGRECFGGLDLATVSDLAALALVFPDGEQGYDVLMRFWLPEAAVAARSAAEAPYNAWCREGWLTPTPGNVIDHNRIRADILELRDKYRVREIAFDRHEATMLSTQLAEEHGVPMVPMHQGTASMNAPSRELERAVMSVKLRHGDNPVLRWMASNVAIYEDDGGRIRPHKKRSPQRIDGITALVMALGRASVQTRAVSLYDDPSYEPVYAEIGPSWD
jgi:phage terminase large subunit-like protein